jgi:hypothetical protein
MDMVVQLAKYIPIITHLFELSVPALHVSVSERKSVPLPLILYTKRPTNRSANIG